MNARITNDTGFKITANWKEFGRPKTKSIRYHNDDTEKLAREQMENWMKVCLVYISNPAHNIPNNTKNENIIKKAIYVKMMKQEADYITELMEKLSMKAAKNDASLDYDLEQNLDVEEKKDVVKKKLGRPPKNKNVDKELESVTEAVEKADLSCDKAAFW